MKVSICLVTFERAHSLGKTLDSLLTQDFEDFELLIQDDASGDATEDLCRAYVRLDPRVSYDRNPANVGMPTNLNRAIARARGAFIANLHDGDIYRRDLLSKWLAAIEAADDVGFVFNAYEVVDGSGRHERYYRHPFGARIERGDLVSYMLERFDSPVWGTVMARRSAYQAVGLFDERFSWIADVEMWMRMNLHFAVAHVAEPLMQLTPHESDRPYARVNWDLEQAHLLMREEIAALHYESDPMSLERYRARLQRMKRRRWLGILGHCFRRRMWADLDRGLACLARDRSPWVRVPATLGWRVAQVMRPTS